MGQAYDVVEVYTHAHLRLALQNQEDRGEEIRALLARTSPTEAATIEEAVEAMAKSWTSNSASIEGVRPRTELF